MSITDSAVQTLIINELGDVNGILAANMPTIWAKHARYRPIPDMQYLVSKREAAQTLITALRATAVNASVGDFREDDSIQVTALEKISGDLSAQIADRMKQFEASAAPAVGTLATTQIEPPPAFQAPSPYGNYVNSNDAVYRGDAYARNSGKPWW